MSKVRWMSPFAIFVLAVLLGSDQAKADQIFVPYDANYEPLSFFDDVSQLPKGYDIEVAKAIAAIAGLEIVFEETDFFKIQGAEWPDSWGYSVASMSRDEDREQRFHFVGPYLYDTVVLVTRSLNPISRTQDVRDVNIGVCTGCVYADYLNGLVEGVDGQPIPGANPLEFTTDPDILREISNPDSDLAYGVTSAFHADYFISLGYPIKKIDPPLFLSPLWIAVPKNKERMISKIETAFQELKDSGGLKLLSKSHLGYDYSDLEH